MTSEQMRKFYEAEQRAKEKEQELDIFIVDTFGRRDGVATRHLAREDGGSWIKTLCGRRVINYHSARLVGQRYTDGSIFSQRCPTCFCKAHGEFANEVRAEYLSAVQGTD